MFYSLVFSRSSQEKQADFKKFRVKSWAASEGFVLRSHTFSSPRIVQYSAPSHPATFEQFGLFMFWNGELENLVKTQIQN